MHIPFFIRTFAVGFEWIMVAGFVLWLFFNAAMVESVDTRDLKSLDQKWLCGFKSHSRYDTGKPMHIGVALFI